ncbi:hypothetical protein BGX38DRAFT_414838 [Terfezia claveryi]|nr:hypothetical protein BGX38DRAFT_414838 [Terfezia claveryi]
MAMFLLLLLFLVPVVYNQHTIFRLILLLVFLIFAAAAAAAAAPTLFILFVTTLQLNCLHIARLNCLPFSFSLFMLQPFLFSRGSPSLLLQCSKL